MRPLATLGLYAGALVVVFGAALGVGHAVGPVGAVGSPASTVPHASPDVEGATGGGAHGAATPDADLQPGGLALSQDGYALQLDSPTHPAGSPAPLSFSISGPDGEPLTELTESHEQELHLVVVRRDLSGYQHLHPTRDAQGRWSVPLTLEPGPYKVFVDFVPAGRDQGLVLAADLTVPGTHVPTPLPAPARTSSVDGYDVSLDGALVAGTSSELVLSVSRDGEPVTDLQPYLGAYGHLVVLRAGDLAYLHVHPDGATDDPRTPAGPEISFSTGVPSAGTYRLFLDFAHDGVVRTAELTAVAPRGSAPAATAVPQPSPSGHSDDPHDH